MITQSSPSLRATTASGGRQDLVEWGGWSGGSLGSFVVDDVFGTNRDTEGREEDGDEKIHQSPPGMFV